MSDRLRLPGIRACKFASRYISATADFCPTTVVNLVNEALSRLRDPGTNVAVEFTESRQPSRWNNSPVGVYRMTLTCNRAPKNFIVKFYARRSGYGYDDANHLCVYAARQYPRAELIEPDAKNRFNEFNPEDPIASAEYLLERYAAIIEMTSVRKSEPDKSEPSSEFATQSERISRLIRAEAPWMLDPRVRTSDRTIKLTTPNPYNPHTAMLDRWSRSNMVFLTGAGEAFVNAGVAPQCNVERCLSGNNHILTIKDIVGSFIPDIWMPSRFDTMNAIRSVPEAKLPYLRKAATTHEQRR